MISRLFCFYQDLGECDGDHSCGRRRTPDRRPDEQDLPSDCRSSSFASDLGPGFPQSKGEQRDCSDCETGSCTVSNLASQRPSCRRAILDSAERWIEPAKIGKSESLNNFNFLPCAGINLCYFGASHKRRREPSTTRHKSLEIFTFDKDCAL